MAGPIAQAGGVAEPSQYAAIAMDEQFTGMWTQRNPLRDADVPYIYRKFYSASRFDSIIDGINREISPELTDKRRAGSPVFNSSNWAPVTSYYSWKYIQGGQEVIRLILDSTDGNIYDFTPTVIGGTGQASLFGKGTGSGAAAFLGLANGILYYGDGVLQQQIMATSGPWAALKKFAPGTLIQHGSPEQGLVYMALGGITMNVKATQSDGTTFTIWVDPENIPDQFANLQSAAIKFAGLTAGSALNGLTLTATIISSTLGIFQVTHAAGSYGPTADTGTATTGNGTTGAIIPTFGVVNYGVTADAGQQWKCYDFQIKNWGVIAPTNAPTLTQSGNARFWQPNTSFSPFYALLDSNGNIELFNGGSPAISGINYPSWQPLTPQTISQVNTFDGAIEWTNLGVITAWQANSTSFFPIPIPSTGKSSVIIDSNGNLQWASAAPGATGASQPVWATTIGVTTTDNAVTWTCLGPGHLIASTSVQYAFSLHAIDGTVSTASPAVVIQGPILGPAIMAYSLLNLFTISGTFKHDTQCDQIWIWRTAVGQATLVLEDSVPMDAYYAGSAFTYIERGIPDTSTYGNGALNALIPALINNTADPPPAGMIPIVYRLGRVWGIKDNLICYSAGPDAVTGNGNTQWPPLNVIPLASKPYTLIDGTTTRGPTLFAWTSSGMRAIYGTGTASDAFVGDSNYMSRAGVAGRFAVDQVGSTFYAMLSNKKLASFDPSGGYIEVGFPIGDQFKNVTTAAGDATTGALYNPATAYVSWYEGDSGDTGLFVSDGAVGWFRFSPISPPESGSLWSPRAAIVGGTSAVQAIETAVGIYTLLIGPPVSMIGPGPILMRDKSGTVFEDNGTAYPSWDAKGSIQMAQTGEVAEISHVALKSVATGARPQVSLLIDEIKAGVTIGGRTTAWQQIPLLQHHEDPPNLESSITMYSDRYRALQGGGSGSQNPPLCHNFQLKIDYGSQNAGDELLYFGIYGATHPERKQQ